jgi:membrane protein DedA with SNARE-associated domain
MPLLVYIFGLTPLPDQLIIIPLGVAKYPFKKIFVPCTLGKATYMLIIAILSSILHQAGAGEVSVISMIGEGIFLAIVFTALVAFISINWKPIFEKHSQNVTAQEIAPKTL